jgi:hypothetical protein
MFGSSRLLDRKMLNISLYILGNWPEVSRRLMFPCDSPFIYSRQAPPFPWLFRECFIFPRDQYGVLVQLSAGKLPSALSYHKVWIFFIAINS